MATRLEPTFLRWVLKVSKILILLFFDDVNSKKKILNIKLVKEALYQGYNSLEEKTRKYLPLMPEFCC